MATYGSAEWVQKLLNSNIYKKPVIDDRNTPENNEAKKNKLLEEMYRSYDYRQQTQQAIRESLQQQLYTNRYEPPKQPYVDNLYRERYEDEYRIPERGLIPAVVADRLGWERNFNQYSLHELPKIPQSNYAVGNQFLRNYFEKLFYGIKESRKLEFLYPKRAAYLKEQEALRKKLQRQGGYPDTINGWVMKPGYLRDSDPVYVEPPTPKGL